MSELQVVCGDERSTLSPDRAYVIGRSAMADVVVESPQVSRRHADLGFDGDAWVLIDRSSAGTFLGDERIEQLRIDGATTLRLGPAGSPELTLTPVEGWSAPRIDVDEGTSQVGTIALTDEALRLDLGDQHLAFQPGQRVVVGRDPACELTTDDPLVSGRHCEFSHDGNGWTIEDLGSTRGTFIDGRRVTTSRRIEGAFEVGLGDPHAGARLRVVTAGTHQPPRDRRPLLLGIGALVLAIAGVVLAIVLTRPDDNSGPNNAAELDRARLATVLVLSPEGTGSGAFVAQDLVLTNRHVAEGQDLLLIATAPAVDEQVEIRYEAELAATHPYLDLALVRIVDGAQLTAEGVESVEAVPTPAPLAFGISGELQSGDEFHALGFPAVSSTFLFSETEGFVGPTASVSEGRIVTFEIWPGCDNPDADVFMTPGGFSDCAPDGDLPRGNLLSDDLSGPGGSGGPVVVDGEIIAVRYAGRDSNPGGGASATGGVALSIPIDFAKDWLQAELR